MTRLTVARTPSPPCGGDGGARASAASLAKLEGVALGDAECGVAPSSRPSPQGRRGSGTSATVETIQPSVRHPRSRGHPPARKSMTRGIEVPRPLVEHHMAAADHGLQPRAGDGVGEGLRQRQRREDVLVTGEDQGRRGDPRQPLAGVVGQAGIGLRHETGVRLLLPRLDALGNGFLEDRRSRPRLG